MHSGVKVYWNMRMVGGFGRRESARRYGNWVAECRESARHYGNWLVECRERARHSVFEFAVRRDASRRPACYKKASEVNFLRGLSYSYFPYSPNIKPGIALISNSLK